MLERGAMRIGILTNFLEFHPGLSLTSIVRDQITMLSRYGHEVTVFVADKYTDHNWKLDARGEYTLRKVVPHPSLTDYAKIEQLSEEHKISVKNIVWVLEKECADLDVVFTHDFIFTGWKLPYALALREVSHKLKNVAWLHWIHSVPRMNHDWWDLQAYSPRNKIVIPNRVHKRLTAQQYRTDFSDVKCVPHIRDIRIWEDFCQEAWDFIDAHPGILQADVVQCYPASTDRLEPKGLDKVIAAFGAIKNYGKSVALICANQWATGTQPKENIIEYQEMAYRYGLSANEFMFTSQFREPDFETGIPHHFLRDLYKLSNVFFFPTIEESFGLTLPEVILSSGCMPVLNFNCTVLHEITNYRGLFFDYPAVGKDVTHPKGESDFNKAVAGILIDQMAEEEAVSSRTYVRKTFNMDAIYANYYEPLLQSTRAW